MKEPEQNSTQPKSSFDFC